MMNNLLQDITCTTYDTIFAVEFRGEFDYGNLLELQQVLVNVPAARHIVVSLIEATYLDSVILHSLAESAMRIETAGRRMFLVRPRSLTLQKLLAVTGMQKRITLVDSLAQAFAAINESEEPGRRAGGNALHA